MTHPGQTQHPRHPRHLVGSAWTFVPADPFRHFVVLRVDRDGNVHMEAVLDAEFHLTFAWRELRDRAKWTPGWQQ